MTVLGLMSWVPVPNQLRDSKLSRLPAHERSSARLAADERPRGLSAGGGEGWVPGSSSALLPAKLPMKAGRSQRLHVEQKNRPAEQSQAQNCRSNKSGWFLSATSALRTKTRMYMKMH